MRSILATLFVFGLLFNVACLLEVNSSAAELNSKAAREWRRTSSGWEAASHWTTNIAESTGLSAVHPLILASLQLLVCSGVLIALADNDEMVAAALRIRKVVANARRRGVHCSEQAAKRFFAARQAAKTTKAEIRELLRKIASKD